MKQFTRNRARMHRTISKDVLKSKLHTRPGRATWDPAFGGPLQAACIAAQTLHSFFAFAFALAFASAFPFALASGLFSLVVSVSVAPADLFGELPEGL